VADGDRLFSRPDAPHGVHDQLLVAAFAAGDAVGADRDHARTLVEACSECAALAADLRSISAATAQLPAPPRRRDFRLTPADAERLRPQGMRRLVGAVAGRRLQLAYPVAGALTMLGLTGLLVSSISFGVPLTPAGTSAEQAPASAGTDMFALPAGSTSNDAQSEAGRPAALSASEPPTQRDDPAAAPTETSTAPADPARDTSRLLIATLSAFVLLAGVALFFVARLRRHGTG
jgi:hypothetical protein